MQFPGDLKHAISLTRHATDTSTIARSKERRVVRILKKVGIELFSSGNEASNSNPLTDDTFHCKYTNLPQKTKPPPAIKGPGPTIMEKQTKIFGGPCI